MPYGHSVVGRRARCFVFADPPMSMYGARPSPSTAVRRSPAPMRLSDGSRGGETQQVMSELDETITTCSKPPSVWLLQRPR